MTSTTKSLKLVTIATLALGTAMPAFAGNSVNLQDACEDAVRAELADGDARFNRVALSNSGDQSSFWLTVRHKAPTDAKSTRYRALCVIDRAGNTAQLDIDEGWWKKGRRGQSPLAVD
ncbi:MAG: hypothetical protein AAAFM81_06560 [Pseudomonadota bacterium]